MAIYAKDWKSLDLNKTWWIEERHDPFKSTKAAISYLDILYKDLMKICT